MPFNSQNSYLMQNTS